MEEKKGRIIYWEMANGHKHSFLTYEEEWENDKNVPSGYFLKSGKEVTTQGEYFEYVQEAEQTYLEGKIEEIEWVSKESLEEAKEKGFIWYSDCDDAESGEIEFI
jgi:hypothetical protein